MEDNLIDEFCPEIREALFDVAESLLNTQSFKIHVDKGSKKGIVFANKKHWQKTLKCRNHIHLFAFIRG